jgi:MFS family permease/DNA polymerase III delta prime subunit
MDEQQKRGVSPITLFYSYAYEDELLRNELEKHLGLLRRQGLISEWHDRKILAGDERAAEIDQHLETASIILLLVSSDFLDSDYCYDIEMTRALERHRRGDARVIPIILRPCDWRNSPFAHLQCLPRNGKAVTMWQNSDEAFLTIAEELRRVIERQRIPVRPLSRVERENRIRLMKRVRATWIEGVLEHSLHQAALIALDLQEQPDALANPWRLEVQETNVPPHLLPAGTPIVQVYDEAGGELLILGEPGAGKTTLLLQLASDLLKRAEQESTSPLPVIFTLASWAEKLLPLTDWLIEELFTKYQVPRNLGRSWVENDQLLLLLDGLDEVPPLHRSSCIQAINMYHQEHTLVPIVLCSRKAEYEAQSTRVTLSKAVVVQPLTPQQIDDYLTQAGQQLEAVRSLLHDDQELQELARTPLMLTILILTYQGKAVDDLLTRMPADAQRQHVLGTYVERMLQRRAVSHYTPDKTKYWSAWLAKQMVEHSQAEFYLESMQMDWLPASQLRWLLPGIVVGLVYGLFSGLVKGIDYGFSPGSDLNGRSFTASRGLIDGLLIGILNALVFASLNGFIFGGVEKREREREASQKGGRWRSKLINVLQMRIVYGSLFGMLNGLLITLLVDWPAGVMNGLVFGVVYAVLGKLETQIQPAEVLTWSWSTLQQNVGKFVVGGMLMGFFYGLLTGLYALYQGHIQSTSWFLPYLLVGLSVGVAVGLMLVLVGCLSHDRLDKRNILKPNQGIWNSARNSVSLGLFSWLLFGLFFGVIYGVLLHQIFQAFNVPYAEYVSSFPKDNGLIMGLARGLVVGAGFWIRNGGVACIQHLLLRVLLWCAGYTPWNYSRFLDYAAERILLRKVGGGYIFIHRLLLDYFAS